MNPSPQNETDFGTPPDPDDSRRIELPPVPARPREPIFNLPGFVLLLGALLVAVHVARIVFISDGGQAELIAAFSFIPGRYGPFAGILPYPGAAWWGPFTYSLLHAGWMHLGVNLLWLAAFASPVARRLGPVRATLIALASSLGGALAHTLANGFEIVPMIGASAVVSGFMGAAARFAFVPGAGGLSRGLNIEGNAQSLRASFSNPQFLIFAGVWFALNFLFGSGIVPVAGNDVSIAWQAHAGGFAAGLVAFSLAEAGRKGI